MNARFTLPLLVTLCAAGSPAAAQRVRERPLLPTSAEVRVLPLDSDRPVIGRFVRADSDSIWIGPSAPGVGETTLALPRTMVRRLDRRATRWENARRLALVGNAVGLTAAVIATAASHRDRDRFGAPLVFAVYTVVWAAPLTVVSGLVGYVLPVPRWRAVRGIP